MGCILVSKIGQSSLIRLTDGPSKGSNIVLRRFLVRFMNYLYLSNSFLRNSDREFSRERENNRVIQENNRVIRGTVGWDIKMGFLKAAVYCIHTQNDSLMHFVEFSNVHNSDRTFNVTQYDLSHKDLQISLGKQ